MIYGYARVSTATQRRDGNSLEEQVSALKAYGCQEIIQEAFNGRSQQSRFFAKTLTSKMEDHGNILMNSCSWGLICCFLERATDKFRK